jgi:hypothetical protein
VILSVSKKSESDGENYLSMWRGMLLKVHCFVTLTIKIWIERGHNSKDIKQKSELFIIKVYKRSLKLSYIGFYKL